jgi:N-acetylmuramoyl-L-alanine amidase
MPKVIDPTRVAVQRCRRRHPAGWPALAALVLVAAGLAAPVASGASPAASGASPARGPDGPPAVRAANLGAAVPVAAAATSDGRGFWVASTDGAVTNEGDAVGHGDASALAINAPVVGITATHSGGGYWLLGGDGGVYSYGDAAFHGSTGSLVLNQPAIQIAATPTGGGYWFVARDGGVFAFGNAGFFGSTGALRLNRPVVGMAVSPTGRGYWLVARDGGIFAFGDAGFHGSTGGLPIQAPVVGMAATADGGGYWLVARDGGVFAFGDAAFHGSAGGSPLPAPAISIVATGDGGGYWILLANGQIVPFGDAASVGTAPIPSDGYSLVGQVVAVDPGHDGGNAGDPAYINAIVPSGPGQSKACDTVGTDTDSGYPEHAFNFDTAERLAAVLRSRGATVVLTRSSDTGVGPCVNVRAAIGNAAGADAAISLHADGAPASGEGFAVLEPAWFPGYNDAVAAASAVLGADVRAGMLASTAMPVSNYDGSAGVAVRSDLGGLNLSTVPKVLVEIGNMKNSTDAALEQDPTFRQQAAVALAGGLSAYMLGG